MGFECVEQSPLPICGAHVTSARNDGGWVKPLSSGITCFYGVLMGLMT